MNNVSGRAKYCKHKNKLKNNQQRNDIFRIQTWALFITFLKLISRATKKVSPVKYVVLK